MKRWFTLILLVLQATSCESGTFGGSGTTANKSKGDDKPRPTEQGEGVVGYLVDPEQLRYSEQDGRTTARGDAGAVAFNGEPTNYEACLQELTEEDLSRKVSEAQGFTAEVKGRGTVNVDGSFEISMDGSPNGILAVNVSGFCDGLPAGGFVPGGTSVVFKRRGVDGFFTASSSDVNMPDEPDATEDSQTFCTGEEEACDRSVSFEFFDKESGKGFETEAKLEITTANGKLVTVVVKPGKEVTYGPGPYKVSASLPDGRTLEFTLDDVDDGTVKTLTFGP